MSSENNATIPVIIGVVGGDVELLSLKPIFEEFNNTFGTSIPVKLILANSEGEMRLFDEGHPDTVEPLYYIGSSDHDKSKDIATYLLRNCHFVLLSATLKQAHPICVALKENAEELPAETPQVNDEVMSVFDLPEPAPILLQRTPKSLDLEIVGREEYKQSASENRFSLALFEYSESMPTWKFWLGVASETNSKYASKSDEKPFSFVRDSEDEMGLRWLDCVKAIHRQATFNDEVWDSSEILGYQPSRFGFPSNKEKTIYTKHCDLKSAFQIQCKADSLASKYQSQWQKLRFAGLNEIATKSGFPRRFISFLWLAGISATALVFSTEFGGLFRGWSGIIASLIYIAILIWCFKQYINVREQSWEQKHQDYRFVAEVLTIQLYWMASGIKKYASDHFPSGVGNDIQWVRHAVHTTRFLSKVQDDGSTFSLDKVCKDWIEEQNAWHKKTFQKRRIAALEVLNNRRSFAGKLFVGFFLIFTIFTAFEFYYSLGDVDETVGWWMEQLHHVIIIIMAVSLVLYALLGEAIEGYGIEQELTRSEALVSVYERCVSEFNNNADDNKKRKLLMDVGGYAIDAEAHWLVIHRERPMQPVKGG